jgi:putative transposase
MIYRFIDTEKAYYPIRVLCRVLSVPESSYFRWDQCGRARADQHTRAEAALLAAIREAHAASGGTYGAAKVRRKLCDAGRRVSERRVAETMAKHGICGVSGRERTVRTTIKADTPAAFPDLVERRFLPCRPDVVWYSDITYIWIGGRFWFLAVIIDAATKQVVGWSLADHMRADLVCEAIHRAVRRRRHHIRAGIIFHSDRGAQYGAHEVRNVCALYKMRQSMGRTGICWDNAAAESFFATLKRELVYRHHWDTIREFHNDLYWWIETWYNNQRIHATIGYITPNQAHHNHYRPQAA